MGVTNNPRPIGSKIRRRGPQSQPCPSSQPHRQAGFADFPWQPHVQWTPMQCVHLHSRSVVIAASPVRRRGARAPDTCWRTVAPPGAMAPEVHRARRTDGRRPRPPTRSRATPASALPRSSPAARACRARASRFSVARTALAGLPLLAAALAGGLGGLRRLAAAGAGGADAVLAGAGGRFEVHDGVLRGGQARSA